MKSKWSSPVRRNDASISSSTLCSGQNSHHSLFAIVTSSRGQPDARKISPKTTSEWPAASW